MKVKTIAEIGSVHDGSFRNAIKLIDPSGIILCDDIFTFDI